MNLLVTAALIAVCGAAKLDRSYLPPPSAATAGGSPGSLQTPLARSPEQGLETPNPPVGSYTNEFGGVVVDAAAPGSRSTADATLSALGGPRPSYGSTDSKVGDAAFSGSAGFRSSPSFGTAPAQSNYKGISAKNTQFGAQGQGSSGVNAQFGLTGQASANAQIDTHASQFPSNGAGNSQGAHGLFSSNGFNLQGFENKSERPQAAKDRNSNILVLSNDVNTDSYSYGFETDNGIAVGENGVAANGIQAEGGYSYQGDDGQVYKVTYTADEGGYRPQGAHLPTPPPIPEEILKSLEQNAKDEASGLIDDGSYDAQKYNADGGYTHDGGNIQYNSAQLSQFGKRPESDATASGKFINQNNQALGIPGSEQFGTAQGSFNGQTNVQKPEIAISAHHQQNIASAFNGQDTQANRGSGQFGVSGSENIQTGEKPGTISFGVTGSQNVHPSFNGQSSNRIPSSGQFESQSTLNGQTTHGRPENFGSTGFHNAQPSFNGQSSQINGNHLGSNLATNQYGTSQESQSSQSINGLHGSSATGNILGQNSGNQFSSSGHSASSSAQVENQSSKPGVATNLQIFNSQVGSIPTKPIIGSSSSNSQSTQSQPESSFKPQGSEAFPGASLDKDQDGQDFGKPYPQTFSGQNFNRPASGNFNFKPQTLGQVQNNGAPGTNFNRFPQAPSSFGSKNENLPPFNTFGQTQPNKPTTGFNSNLGNSGFTSSFLNNQNSGNGEQKPGFVALNAQQPSFASASASTLSGQFASQPQSANPLITFNNQQQYKPNQFNQQTNQFSSQAPSQIDSNTQQSLGTQSVHSFDTKPTSVPDTELTTPLEPNDVSASHGPQASSQTTASFGNFDSKPINSNIGQSQSGSQGNSFSSQQSTTQNISPSFPTSSQSNTQIGASSIGSFGLNSGNGIQGQGHFSSQQNAAQPATSLSSRFPQQPFSSDTNKPQIPENANQNQLSSNQDINSYYYNQPSKPFGALAARPQGSRFPVSLPHQPIGVASQSQNFNQQSSFQSSSKFSGSPVALPSAQLPQNQGFNGVTQAAVSSFPPANPIANQMNQNGQFGLNFNQQSSFTNQAPNLQPTTNQLGSKPSFSQQTTFTNQAQQNKFSQPGLPVQRPIPQFGQTPISSSQAQFGHNNFEQNNKPDSSDGLPQDGSTQQQTSVTQQYQGTVYEYNKPPESLPAPSDSSSSQSVETSVASELKPSFGIQSNQQNSKPTSQTEALNQNKPFGSASSANQIAQSNQYSQETEIQSGSQSDKTSNSPSTSMQFNHNIPSFNQQATPFGASSFLSQSGQTAQQTPGSSNVIQQNTQTSPTAQAFKPFGTASLGVQSAFGANPQFGSQSLSQTTQPLRNPQSNQPAQVFGSQTLEGLKPASNQGYFYNKPQFPESSKILFNQNPEFISKPGSFNQQNTQFNTAFKPQFGVQTLTQGSLQSTGSFNQPSSNAFFKPQFGTQTLNQNTQTTFSQKSPSSPIQPFTQPQIGQSSASSEAASFGQGSASASASTSQYKPFEQKPQASEQKPESQDQSEQGTQQLESQSSISEGSSDLKPYGALNFKPGGSQGSKPLFNSPCCQNEDTVSAQSADKPSTSFQGSSFSAQSFAGKGEQFGGPRPSPRFDENGYHY